MSMKQRICRTKSVCHISEEGELFKVMREEKAKFHKCILNQLAEIMIFPFAGAIIIIIILCKINIDLVNIITFLFLQIVGAVLYLVPDMVWVRRYNTILKEGKLFEGKVKEISWRGGFRTPLMYIKITAEFEDVGIKKYITQEIKVCLDNKCVDRTILKECHYGEINQKIDIYWVGYDKYIIIGSSVGLTDIYHC